jgi:iron complex outermembrane receptor protein
VAAALLATGLGAWAQPAGDTVTVTAPALPAAGIGGFPDVPLARSAMSTASFGAEQLADLGIAGLGDIGRLDASVGEAYNAPGYWASFSVRGYTLDNRANYRRDGLPVNAETAIALDNKERVELLKGVSGIQAGVSAPGGLVDLIVKRPATGPVRSAWLDFAQGGAVRTAVDLSERFGRDGRFGLRLNQVYEHLDPNVRDAQGHRRLSSVAADWRVAPGTRLEVEVERGHRQQPSVAGFSMLGARVPSAAEVDPRVNLNHQPWSRPVVMDGTTGSVRLLQELGGPWRLTAHAMTQRLTTQDRTAFPYGDFDASYGCYWCDRYASDGRFSYWEYVSENERRRTDVLDLRATGQARTGALTHALQFGVTSTRHRARFQDQVFDLALDPSGDGSVGLGRIDGSLDTLPSYGWRDANTDRDERSTEWYVRDRASLAPGLQLWAGLRHTRLERSSQRTSPDAEGSLRATRYTQSATVPWLAVSAQLGTGTMAYASWGRGLETDVAPNRQRYVNAGQALPALLSRQTELGLKHEGRRFGAAMALFDIDRPQAADQGNCDVEDSCRRVIDGSARHRGLELLAEARAGHWQLGASALWLRAMRRGSADPSVNGQRPVNVPSRSARLNASYRVPTVAGLQLAVALAAEGNRVVLPYDPSARIPGWSRLDLGARWDTRTPGAKLVWRIGVDNVTDRRAWKESPYQFGHAYLYPLAPRQRRTSVQATF